MFLEHTDKITGIKFSQINDALMISSGMDKRLNFYDTKQLKVVKNWNLSEPINCIDFYNNGMYIVMGSIYGTVALYDLRMNKDTPMMIFNGQRNKVVNGISFNLKYEKKHIVVNNVDDNNNNGNQ